MPHAPAPRRNLLRLALAVLPVACTEPTAPGVRMEAAVEGHLVVIGDIPWHTLELTALPTLLDCATGDPLPGPVNVYSGGALYENFDFEATISGRMETSLNACFDIEVKAKEADQGPRVQVGPVEFAPAPGGHPLDLRLEYDAVVLRILP